MAYIATTSSTPLALIEVSDKMYKISSLDEYRIDLIANNISEYKNVDFGWVLLLVNRVESFNDLRKGNVLRYPSRADIYRILLKYKEK